MKKVCSIAVGVLIALSSAGAQAVPPLKQMPIDFVGEWCNGTTSEGTTNWQLPSWLDDSEKCTNILSIDKYEFRMVIGKTDYACTPDAIRARSDTAPSGTT